MPRSGFAIANYLLKSSAQAMSGAITVCGWIYPTATAALGQIWGLNRASSNTYLLALVQAAGGALTVSWRNGGTACNAVNANVTLNAWNFVALQFTPGAGTLLSWLGTVGVAYEFDIATWPTGIDRTAIGARYATATVDRPYTGHVGPFAVWLSSLTSEQISLLAAGLDMRCLPNRPPAAYYPMTGTAGATDVIGGFDLSEIGAVTEYTTTVPPQIVPPAPCVVLRKIEGEFERLVFAWTTDLAGKCILALPEDLAGMLYRFEARHSGAGLVGADYDVRLLDEQGVDVLMGLGTSLAYNTVEADVISMTPAADVHLPVLVMGRHTIEVDAGADATSGLFELLVYRDARRRMIE
ncbi:LamG domain-containing protein [bacterium]|nr:LamG domain-containing protein [bacterium]